jgi:cytochrome d ubiquinol oxidase subunit II
MMHTDPSFLQVLWFVLIAVLWGGYFILEGFDFGVGMLIKLLGRDDVDTRVLIHTIGPVWDGNEVWLITAGGATFAAFPAWYASAFSGFYLALFLVLAGLIVRGVSFEFWGKSDSKTWRSAWVWAIAISSGLVALLLGVAWANFIHGVPMGAGNVVHANLWDLLHPYALLGGLTTLSLFFAHGANFLALRLKGELHDRATAIANRAAPVAALITIAFLIWTMSDHSWETRVVVLAVIAILKVACIPFTRRRSEGLGFLNTTAVIVWLTATFFAALYPNVLVSTTNPADTLTIVSASSGHYTLVVMTVVAVLFVPVVVLYQGWTYWVFRHRLGRDDYEGPLNPIAVAEKKFGGAG